MACDGRCIATSKNGDDMTTTPEIRIALPSKGRMEGETLEFLEGCGLRVDKTNPRQYSATIPLLPQVLVLFQRAPDIPRSVAAGDMDLGITGYDTVVESLDSTPEEAGVVVIHDALRYGGCRLVVAVPDEWDDVSDLPSLAARARREGGLRVATKHTNSTQRFLTAKGLDDDVQIVGAAGALEAAPAVGSADFIADITSTGTTLNDNHLRPLPDGVIVESQAVLIGNREALHGREDVLTVARQLLELFEAHLRARGQYMVFANMRGETREDIAQQIFTQTDLGGLQGPTISPIISREDGIGWWAINIVVGGDRLYESVRQIRAIGGSGVIAAPATYIFEERPVRYQRLLAALGRETVQDA
jgi:ATP phosphoribosyltransferase